MELMEQSLVVGSSYSVPREDRIEIMAFKRGIIAGFDFILAGGLDEKVRNLVGLDAQPPAPVEDYMRTDIDPENTEESRDAG